MKKNLYDNHYERVVDKDWVELSNENKTLGFQKGVVIPLCIFEVLVLFLRFCVDDESNVCVFFFASYFSIIGTIFLNQGIRNMVHYKKVFRSQLVWVISFSIVMLLLWGSMFGVLPCRVSSVVVSVVVFFLLSIAGVSVITVLSFKDEKVCNYKIIALCVDNISRVVERYTNNSSYDKVKRSSSVAYPDDEYVTVYTPVFNFMFNGIEYTAQPNFSKNTPYEVGSEYEIFVNPSNPNEIRL